MARLNRDVYIALILLVIWGVFFWQTLLVEDMGYATIGSEVWPQIILVVLFVLTAGYLAQSVRQGAPGEQSTTVGSRDGSAVTATPCGAMPCSSCSSPPSTISAC